MKNNYIVIGDSIVYGVGGTKQSGWVSELKKELLNREDTKNSTNFVHCVGFPGATSKDILEKIEAIIDTYYSKENNNVFILSIGVNDTQIFKGKNKNSIEDYKNNIEKIISIINKKENCKLIISGLTEIEVKEKAYFWKPEKYYDNATIINYDKALKDICISNDITYISMIGVLDKTDFIDGLHPNDEGYNKIFKKVLSVL